MSWNSIPRWKYHVTEVVAAVSGEESLEAAASADAAEAEATPVEDELATLKKRLSGKDQALTRTKAEAEQLKAEKAEYQRKLAEYENANLTEVERLQKERDAAVKRADLAEQKALRAVLERKFPLTFDLLGDRTPVDDEAWLAEREARLRKEGSEEESASPTVNANNPRRPIPSSAKALNEKSADELLSDLQQMGNPMDEWGT